LTQCSAHGATRLALMGSLVDPWHHATLAEQLGSGQYRELDDREVRHKSARLRRMTDHRTIPRENP